MIRRAFTTALAAGIAVTAHACADQPATAPGTLAPSAATAMHWGEYRKHEGRRGSDQAALVRCERHPAYEGSAEIGPRGGQIVVGNSRVIVPPGALSEKVSITATMPAGETVSISFEFEPHGLVFKKPAGLVLDARGCDIPSYYAPDIVYLSDSGEVLERIQAYYSNHWHIVAAPIWHFSSYALAW